MQNDTGEFLVAFLFVFVLAFAAIVGVGVVAESNTCVTLQTLNPDFNFQWVFWGGCLVQTPSGYWTHRNNYRFGEVNIQR